jgi:hypothetical protein
MEELAWSCVCIRIDVDFTGLLYVLLTLYVLSTLSILTAYLKLFN